MDCIALKSEDIYYKSNDYASNCGPEFATVHNSLTRAQPCETHGSEILYGDGIIRAVLSAKTLQNLHFLKKYI